MRVVFMGTPEFAVPPLEHLILDQYELVAAYTRPDKPTGRGRSLVPSPLKMAALAQEVPVVQPVSFKQPEAVAQLADFNPDVVVVAAFGQILPQAVLDIPRYGCVNIHPSLLPRFRGVSPVAAAILAGDEFTGVSIMLLDEGVDTGPVFAQAQIPISAWDTAGSLTVRLSLVAAHLLLEVLSQLSRGGIIPRPQSEVGATYSEMMSKDEGKVDWHLSAEDIWRRVRAFQPWPGCYTRWRGKQLRVIEAVPLPREKSLEVGRVVALNEKGTAFGVGTGDGILGVLRVQLEGKRAMPAAEFLRGQRQLIGAVLPSS